MLKIFQKEQLEKMMVKYNAKLQEKQKEDKRKMKEYKSLNPDDTKSDITIDFEQWYEDDDLFGLDIDGILLS